MVEKQMKTFTAGDTKYIINDAEARAEVADLKSQMSELEMKLATKFDNAFLENGFQYFESDNVVVVGPLGPFAGGGGGGGSSGNNAVITVTNTSGWMSKTIAKGSNCIATLEWSSLEDNTPTGDGTLTVTVSNAVKAIMNVQQGAVSVDLSKYANAGSNVIKVNIADTYGNSRTINFFVTVVELSISSSFDSSVAYTGPISFPYTPLGNVSKTVYFILDGVTIGTNVTSVSGRQQSYTITQQRHGAHKFRCYFEAEINGEIVRSNELYYEITCLEQFNETPIITSNFTTDSVSQYTTLHIDYSIYNPASLTSPVKIYVNNNLVSEQTVDRTTHVFDYRPDEIGTYIFKIESGTAEPRTFTVAVTESEVDVEAETEALALYLSSAGRSNNEATKDTWEYNDIHCTMSGFNWTSDGWQRDEDGTPVLRVAGDSRVTVPYKIFENDFRSTGKTIEIEFATRDVMNYDSTILSCFSGGRGISMTAQSVKIASEQRGISAQFKEDAHVRISFVIQKRVEQRLILCYINGIMSGSVQYPDDDDFSQQTPVNISIGSNDCTIDLYCIRVYDNDLTRVQILDNWIADTQTIEDMLYRYNHNKVYDEYGSIVIENIPSDLPYLILTCNELPQYKGDKKTCSGSYVNPVNPSKSFTFANAQIDVQGTTAQYYARKNYKVKFKGGFVLSNGSTVSEYQFVDGCVPTNTFCFKADVASSEGANNVELARLYNDACPYKTPSQRTDSRIRQGIDGFPIVVFWNDGNSTTFIGKYNFNNDKGTEEVFGFVSDDESWEIRNNTSNRVIWKSADYDGNAWLNDFEARYPDTDPAYEDPTQLRELAEWIVSTDTTKATNSALSSPVTYQVTVTHTRQIVDEETGAITYEEYETVEDVTFTTDSAEYRLAKFKAEMSNYIEIDSALFYYLFTELFLMVDSRAKNAFPSFMGSVISDGGESA